MERSKTGSPSENFSRSSRRVRSNTKSITKSIESKDQENVNNTSLELVNIDTTIKDEATKKNTLDVKLHATAVNLNSSTPRRKKDPLANLHSNLSPKYIGFTTPPNQLNSSNEERTRSLRRRHNNSNNIIDNSEDKEPDITFTPNTEGTVGFVRRTPRNMEPQLTPKNSTQRKKFVSPIDKLLIKNGAVMEFNNNLPLVDNDVKLKIKVTLLNSKSKNKLDEMELGVKKLENYDDLGENNNCSSTSDNIEITNENKEDDDNFSISSEIANQMDEFEDEDEKSGKEAENSDVEEISEVEKNSEAEENSEVEENSNESDLENNDDVNSHKHKNEEKDSLSSQNDKIEKAEISTTDETETISDIFESPQDENVENDNIINIDEFLYRDENETISDVDESENLLVGGQSPQNEEVERDKISTIECVDLDENETLSDTDKAEGLLQDVQTSQDEKVENDSVSTIEFLYLDDNETISDTDESESFLQDSHSPQDEKFENEASATEKCLGPDLTTTRPERNESETLCHDKTEVCQIPHPIGEESVTAKTELIDKSYFEDKNETTKVLTPIDETLKDNLETIKRKIVQVKVEVESVENESNSHFTVHASAPANSPSAVSMDSAKGSSIINDVPWVPFSTGDLYWGQIYNYCYWPCMVCPDPDGKTISTEEVGRSDDQTVLVHVRFFADNGRRNWVKRENLIQYNGVESYQERIVEIREKYGIKSGKYRLHVPTKKKEQVWNEAVNEANVVAEVAYADRLAKFYELFEKSKAFQKLEKQRRKSMYISVNSRANSDIESLYGSNDNMNNLSLSATIKNKRERSISPYSPAYSPIKCVAAKRQKLSGDQELATFSSAEADDAIQTEEKPTSKYINSSQTTSIASASSQLNSLNDLDIFNGLEFRKFYAVMKDFVMEQNHNEKLEKSLVVAVRNIWALKQLGRRQMERKLRESLTEIDLSPALELTNARSNGEGGSVKRLSSRLKTLSVRKSLMAQQTNEYTHERSVTPKSLTQEVSSVEKVKRPKNRPILEVIDDIFDLDTKYLFKGMGRDPVCKYCFKPGGNLRKCTKNCTSWLHKDCLYKDLNKQKKAQSHKNLNETKTNSDTLNDSQSTSLVSLIEVGSVNHVTGDSSEVLAVDVICKECANNELAKCMVCCSTDSKKQDDPLVKCNMSQCERIFHPACCKYWPQAKITISKNIIESFRCPSHVCHTCVSDDPKGKFQLLNNTKLTKCVKCPATYHTDSTCIPAGSQILTAAHIICPRHSSTQHDMTVNVNWCFICVGGGQLMCCETCPTAVHAHCLKIPIAANEGYICEECESGRMPLYGEMVWAKFTVFRWWPAIILPPTEIPKNIARKTHNPSDFVVRFFGTHDHGWISRRRVYLYLEGDSSEPPKSRKGLEGSYNKGVEEAKEVYELIKAKKLEQCKSNEDKEKLHPQPYVRIKANRPVPPVKLHVDIESVSKCECDPREENPCGPDTNCLNRVLYHECNPKLCPAGERCQNHMFESRISPRLDVVYLKERGFGLVCREPIKSGSFVIEYVGEIINDDEFQARMQQKSHDRDENFYFLSVEKDYIIDAGPKGNLARFMNHSCDPNCETQKWSVNSLNRVGLFAIKDIPANTELTFNYHWDDLLGNEKKTCYCGAKKCAGQIGGKIKELETVKEPTALNGTQKNKLKRKTKRNKKILNGRIQNKLTSKAERKTMSNKKKAVAAVSAHVKQTTATTTSKAVKKESEVNDEASTSRLLESPDIFS